MYIYYIAFHVGPTMKTSLLFIIDHDYITYPLEIPPPAEKPPGTRSTTLTTKSTFLSACFHQWFEHSQVRQTNLWLKVGKHSNNSKKKKINSEVADEAVNNQLIFFFFFCSFPLPFFFLSSFSYFFEIEVLNQLKTVKHRKDQLDHEIWRATRY